MLSYRHLFHAGNFADVFKHVLLTRLLIALARKDGPFCYLETHAGSGLYDLTHPWAQKNSEFLTGIARIWDRSDHPKALDPYLDIVKRRNPDGELRCYPGSPAIAHELLRPRDRMVLAELNADDCASLKALFAGDPRVGVHHRDGYQALKAFLPPHERRGVILIDASFDRAKELARITQALSGAYRRFAQGVFAVWYPLLAAAEMRGFDDGVCATGIRKILRLELAIAPPRAVPGMRGCGMLVVNPPYRLADEVRPMIGWLQTTLSPARAGGVEIEWLVPE